DAGTCSAALRDSTVTAANALVTLVNIAWPTVDTASVAADASFLGSASGNAAISAALQDLSDSAAALGVAVCEAAQHLPSAKFTPSIDAVILGDSATFTLTVTNQGSVATSYAVTATLPTGPDYDSLNLNPGESQPLVYSFTAPALGFELLKAQVVATGPDVVGDVSTETSAGLNVVNQFVQITSVEADPPFVETGVSSTTVKVDVANVANLRREVTARTTVVNSGGATAFTDDQPLTILPGSPQRYELQTVDTSGWASGVYTVEVELLDGSLALVPDGYGFAPFGVGQALGASHSVSPLVVAPGDVAVTTVITTEILVDTVVPTEIAAAPLWQPTGLRNNSSPATVDETVALEETVEPVDVILASTDPVTDDLSSAVENLPSAAHSPLAPAGYTRTESSDPAVTYTGSWNTTGILTPSSGGNAQRSTAIGSTASFSFIGTWVNVGFVTTDDSGAVELFLDGNSQGIVDLYSNKNGNLDIIFDGLSNTTHTINLTTLPAVNPNATNERVYLDFFDTWDGTPIPNGSLEQDSSDFLYSNNWNTTINGGAVASGGTYARSGNGTAWLPFEGDSISVDVYKYNGAGPAEFFVDGQHLARVDLFSVDPVAETISFTGFGSGLHLLTLRQHQNLITVDRVTTPATTPAYSPPVQTGILRIEEFDPAIRYDGLPFTTTVSNWNYDPEGTASRGDTTYNGNTAGATVSYEFAGDWVSLGLVGTDQGGQVDVTIDGLLQETIDTYRRANEPIGRVYNGFGPGSHTITLTVLPTSNPLSGQNRLYFDYFETWDGAGEPAGTFEADLQDIDRLRYSGGWSLINEPNAAGGSYVRSGSGSVWFHFTGDSVTYEAFAYTDGDIAQVWLDGSYVTTLNLESPVDLSRTLTLDSLGAGPHVLLVRAPRGVATADRFHAPAIEPATDLACGPYCRYEDEHPDLRYNGFPLNQAASTFFPTANNRASGSYVLETRTAGDTVGLAFGGAAIAVGLHAYERGGLVDITIDGALVETVDTYSPDPFNLTRFYPLPVNGSHTISVALTGAQHPNALNARLQLDFIDVWDGTALPGGTQEIETAAYVNANWGELSDPVASGGTYRRSQPPVSYNHQIGTIWIPFEGDSVQFDAIARSFDDPYARVFVDGIEQPSINLWNGEAEVRTFAFDGFGPGAHLLQITGERAIIALDTVTTPATQPAHSNPSPVGLIRYEEDAFTYDGYSWNKRPTGWVRVTDTSNAILVSGYSAYEMVRTNQAGRSASLTFTGSWANLGFLQYSSGGTAEIYLDGVLTRTISLNGPKTITETQFTLTPGSHTIDVSVVGDGQVVLDFLDVYDDTPVADGLIDAWLGDPQASTRLHFSNSFDGILNPDAIGDRYMNAGAALWYTFVGDSFSFYGFGINNTSNLDVYIDNQFVDTVNLSYGFSNSPLAFHFNGLSNGPHSVRIQRGGNIRADAFASPATNTPYLPIVEWNGTEARGNAGSCGICSGFTAGDINDDGIVELVFGSATSGGNKLFVYRGDGGDTGDGDAVIWSDAYGSGDIGTPALGELDPAYAGTEIVVLSNASLRVYHADGSLWWEDTSITMYDYIGAATLGNLDADPEPEIVVNAREELMVLDADGTELWSITKATPIGIPLLADITGDGVLDIVLSEYGKSSFPTKPAYVYLYDFNLGTPNLVWTHTLITDQDGLFGSMAVADVDGQLPGGDPDPEIAVSSDGNLTVLNDDGSVLWTIPLDPGEPGGVSVADIDGDGEIEIITGMRYEFESGRFGKLYAVNADGSLLWSVNAEDSTSANSAAVLDLNGDGIYEIAWNGLEQGFNIFNGLDGSVLFNDPTIYTRSGTDYPIIVDVDGDGSAEIVIATQVDGVVVIGFDGLWGQARSLWNQHAYHITNVNDDLTIPDTELDSWAIHNTYKTQYPGEVVLPIFGVNISHTVGTEGLNVTGFSVPPNLSADPTYEWDYVQTVSSPVVVRTLDLSLNGMAPGEARLVAAGTTISYTLGSGQNTLHLPPLWVAAPHIVALAPETQTSYAGSIASFDVVLTNPAAASDAYTLTVNGLPVAWSVSLPASVAVGPGATVTETLQIQLPQDALGDYPLTVVVENGAGGMDQASGLLQVNDALDVAITPLTQESRQGVEVDYTVTITNHIPSGETVALAVSGLDDHDVTLVSSLPVPANGSATTTLAVTPQAGPRSFGFAVTGTAASGAADSAQAVLDVVGLRTVAVSIDPASAAGGPGSPAQFTLTVTNTGTLSDTFLLDVALPAGWSYELTRNGAPTSSVSLRPLAFNSAELLLTVTPPLGASAGAVPFTVSAQSTALPGVQGSDTANVQVLTRGVTVATAPQTSTLSPEASGAWSVTITNRG
ncbi:MAG: hypothetical protein KDH89_09480, partial [Anaerolineae bacterium]|nr:hypothetical protein [Anaerolineae bacterium]